MLCPHGLPVEGAPIAPTVPDTPVPPVTPLATSTRPPVVRRLPDPPSLLTPGIERDPYPLYRTLRQRFPLVYDRPFGAWLVSRYADVRAALADPRLVAAPPGRTLAHLEGGTHSAHRALVSPAFRGHALTALTAGVERTAYVLARRLADRQEADLVAEFCHWLPTAAAVAALGLPYEDTARVHAWCRTGLDHLGGHHPELDAFLLPYIARRRAHPGDDLLSALCTARADGRPLSDEAVAGIAGTLLGAGGEATAHALASFLANLLDHPGQLALVRARPELTAGAWAESLRRDPPLHIVLRRAVEPVGAVPVGATVACLLGAAGRDPARFADPDRYDVFRPDPGQLAYGSGRHFCPGALLARLTAEHGLHALFAALPELRRSPGFHPVADGLLSRSPRSLLVRLGRPAPEGPPATARKAPPHACAP
ncbi:cytochrome P450 [Streptomyces olivochromogenes]|uniref:Cytochrome P450 n=1 Tax=Streptomyces olivochromogenes TaxID=1963 RepID=A0A250VPJ9_STROL|nr:cytochrome P450 [Streptomyces olivochromogenes]GAX56071.1 cytochrome P450 [Streptomyces olivochromogenes]